MPEPTSQIDFRYLAIHSKLVEAIVGGQFFDMSDRDTQCYVDQTLVDAANGLNNNLQRMISNGEIKLALSVTPAQTAEAINTLNQSGSVSI